MLSLLCVGKGTDSCHTRGGAGQRTYTPLDVRVDERLDVLPTPRIVALLDLVATTSSSIFLGRLIPVSNRVCPVPFTT
jgi:hypothetical protein